MHKEILTENQISLLPLVKEFKKEFILVGGTAIALHIGHRRSIDFDLFTEKSLKRKSILNKIKEHTTDFTITRSVTEQLNAGIKDVKITFFQFPFSIKKENSFNDIIFIPSLLTLAAMKAYALGGRGKWKDYVDLYFILKNHFTIEQIVAEAKNIFNELFIEKLFCSQLSYFDDINYTEEVEFVNNNHVSEQEVKDFLIDVATKIL